MSVTAVSSGRLVSGKRRCLDKNCCEIRLWMFRLYVWQTSCVLYCNTFRLSQHTQRCMKNNNFIVTCMTVSPEVFNTARWWIFKNWKHVALHCTVKYYINNPDVIHCTCFFGKTQFRRHKSCSEYSHKLHLLTLIIPKFRKNTNSTYLFCISSPTYLPITRIIIFVWGICQYRQHSCTLSSSNITWQFSIVAMCITAKLQTLLRMTYLHDVWYCHKIKHA